MKVIDLHPDSGFPFLVPPLRECLTVKSPCAMGLVSHNMTVYWHEISDYFCFLTLPVLLIFAIITQIISVIVLSRQVRQSLDTYLMGLNIATMLLLLSTALLSLQHYVGPHDLLVYAQPYTASCRDWFWYSAIWLLVMMSFERMLTVSASRANTLCTSSQAAVVVTMVFAVGLVSALPRFWEYEAVEVLDPQTNATSLIAEKTMSTTTEEYNTMYFWYVKGVTLFAPFGMMILMCLVLACRTRRAVLTKRYTAIKHTNGLTVNRKMKEEVSMSKLLIVLMCLYMLCSSPASILDLLAQACPALIDPASRTFSSLYNIFTVIYFFQFALHLMIYFTFNKPFRLTMLAIFCCCC
ncbi:FMRFamide receptor [Biomphalaria glabrata]|nr:FMRFamide receptor [Biomphalaria glabrata]